MVSIRMSHSQPCLSHPQVRDGLGVLGIALGLGRLRRLHGRDSLRLGGLRGLELVGCDLQALP